MVEEINILMCIIPLTEKRGCGLHEDCNSQLQCMKWLLGMSVVYREECPPSINWGNGDNY